MTAPTDLEMAEARAEGARARLSSTVGALQARLAPSTIAREAVDSVADTGERALEAGKRAAQQQPTLVAGGAALVGLFLARKPIAALVSRLRGGKKAQPARRTGVATRTSNPKRS